VQEPVIMAVIASATRPPTLLEALQSLVFGLVAILSVMGVIVAVGMVILWLVA
jgi:hypothetical protein